MEVTRYFTQDRQKVYSAKQALDDSGWCVPLDHLEWASGLRLMDRHNPECRVTVLRITHDQVMGMHFVYFQEGGWQSLDNAVDQFERDTRSICDLAEMECRKLYEGSWGDASS